MLEERGQVVAVEPGAVLVEVQRRSACGSCQARAACGQGLGQMLRQGSAHQVRALTDLQLAVGDVVTLGVSEDLLLHSALLVYLLPLVALLAGAGIGRWFGLAEGAGIMLAMAGFVASLLFLRNYNKRNANNSRLVPVVLRAEINCN